MASSNTCDHPRMQRYLNNAFSELKRFIRNSSPINPDTIKNMSEREAINIMNRVTKLDNRGNYTTNMEHEHKRIEDVYELDRYDVDGDSYWKYLLSDLFNSHFLQCQKKLNIVEPRHPTSPSKIWIREFGQSVMTVHSKDMPMVMYSLKDQLMIAKIFVKLLKKCSKFLVIYITLINEQLGNHQNYFILELSSTGGNRQPDELNIYIYDPHGVITKSAIDVAYFIGKCTVNYLSSKQKDIHWKLNVLPGVLCPIGIQTITRDYDPGFCVIYSLISMFMTVHIWIQMVIARDTHPIHVWGNCIEKYLIKTKTNRGGMYSPSQLMVLTIAFMNALINRYVWKKNQDIAKANRHLHEQYHPVKPK